MGKLINIDNGGTLTDICVTDGDAVWLTKVLTTPFDLSHCLIEGLKKASTVIYGAEDLETLLLSTDHIRYSTTQGTNAIVERKGPRLGLVHDGGIDPAALAAGDPGLFAALVGERVARIDTTGPEGRMDAVRAVSDLAARGTNRIVVAFGGPDRQAHEAAVKRAMLRAFPAHLLGAVPILYSHEVDGDDDDTRRTWTALLNAFLHPAMERFLYAAERKLRAARSQRPLLVFRNDGRSARVARTVAIKTYSSGPRGGAEGAQALARHYGFERLVSVDIGGTTTDIGVVEHGSARAHAHGRVGGVETSLPLTDVTSVGVGGSSIVRVEGGAIIVGPESVGSAPGPACFGLGGTSATITDAFFASGLLDPASFFGGKMSIDLDRAANAVAVNVATPLGVAPDAAIAAMETAWVAAVANGVRDCAPTDTGTVLAAFGGAGPFVVCRVGEALDIDRVLIPKLAAIFSAFGIGFSDIGVSEAGDDLDALRLKVRRAMAAEGLDPAACEEIETTSADGSTRLDSVYRLPHPTLTGSFGGAASAATSGGTRTLLLDGARRSVPLYRTDDLFAGAGASGPAVLENEFFTCRIDAGWRFDANAAGDLLITRTGATS